MGYLRNVVDAFGWMHYSPAPRKAKMPYARCARPVGCRNIYAFSRPALDLDQMVMGFVCCSIRRTRLSAVSSDDFGLVASGLFSSLMLMRPKRAGCGDVVAVQRDRRVGHQFHLGLVETDAGERGHDRGIGILRILAGGLTGGPLKNTLRSDNAARSSSFSAGVPVHATGGLTI